VYFSFCQNSDYGCRKYGQWFVLKALILYDFYTVKALQKEAKADPGRGKGTRCWRKK